MQIANDTLCMIHRNLSGSLDSSQGPSLESSLGIGMSVEIRENISNPLKILAYVANKAEITLNLKTLDTVSAA